MNAFIIMLSYAKDIAHYNMTQRAIDSIHASSTDTKFKVVVFETAKAMPHEIPIKPVAHSGLVKVDADGNFVWDGDIYRAPNVNSCSIWVDDLAGDEIIANGSFLRKKNPRPVSIAYGGEIKYIGAETIQVDGRFNYNVCVNKGVELAKKDPSQDWVAVMNNDIIAHEGWFEAIYLSGYKSCSPISPGYGRQEQFKETTKGFVIGEHVSGWCIATHKDIWDKVFPLDEKFWYYHQDCDYSVCLLNNGIDHVVVPTSKVTHLLSQTAAGYDHKDWLFESTKAFYSKHPNEWYLKRTGFHSAYWSWSDLFGDKPEPKCAIEVSKVDESIGKDEHSKRVEIINRLAKARAARKPRKKHNE